MDIGHHLIDNEAVIRFSAFAVVFALMAAWEVAAPRRALSLPKGRRWTANLGVTLLNAALVRVLQDDDPRARGQRRQLAAEARRHGTPAAVAAQAVYGRSGDHGHGRCSSRARR